MKKIILLLVLGAILSSFTTAFVYQLNDQSAEVTKIEGVSVFHDSKPVKSYQVLGSFAISNCTTCEYADVKVKAVNEARKDYPQLNGVMISGRMGEIVTVIKFD